MCRKPGCPPAPQRPALFARKSDAASPRCLAGLFSCAGEIFSSGENWSGIERRPNECSAESYSCALVFCAIALSAEVRAQTALANSAPAPVYKEVVDEVGRTIRIRQPVQRIVPLAPSLTETIYALGLQDRLVGDTDFCDYPADA